MHRVLILAGVCLGAVTAPATAQSPRVERLLDRLTLSEKAAQVVMLWADGSSPDAANERFHRVAHLVDSLGIGGIVMSRGTPEGVARNVAQLQSLATIPLLMAADFEYGTAFRIRGGSAFPTNMGVGASASEKLAYRMGRIIAEEGRALGIHVTFSPVVDINNNPENPIINTRSFGADPELVGRLAAAQVRGTQDAGMFATAKHFPGHGNTSTDSHLGLPVVESGWEALDALELVPFRAAIDAGVELVMSAHIALPQLDSGRIRPATLLPQFLTGILRDSLGFQGLVVTDALDMGGVVSGYGPEEAAVQAFVAGSDILLMPTDPVAAVSALVKAVEEGRVSLARLEESVRRILTIKDRLRLLEDAGEPTPDLEAVFSRPSTRDAVAEASARALVLVKDSLGVVESLRRGPRSLALLSYGEANAESVGTTLAGELRRKGYAPTVARLGPESGAEDYENARRVLAAEEVRVILVSIRALESRGRLATPPALIELLRASAAGGRSLVVALGSPYVLSHVPDLPGYLAGWEANPAVERAVALALTGAAITGRLPIDIPPAWPIGTGMQVPERR